MVTVCLAARLVVCCRRPSLDLPPKFREQFPGVSFFAFAETKVDSLMTQLIRKPLGAARQIISAFSELPIGLSRAQEYGIFVNNNN